MSEILEYQATRMKSFLNKILVVTYNDFLEKCKEIFLSIKKTLNFSQEIERTIQAWYYEKFLRP